MTDVTTIKVSKPLRQRIAGDAATEGVTTAVFLERLVDRYERERRLSAVGRVYSGGVDEDYAAETQAWDAAAGDGLDQ
jgi:hypothetical protein